MWRILDVGMLYSKYATKKEDFFDCYVILNKTLLGVDAVSVIKIKRLIYLNRIYKRSARILVFLCINAYTINFSEVMLICGYVNKND
ncbi:MAG: hypothetical protein ACTJLM_01575 [Ehrlichia sp.]